MAGLLTLFCAQSEIRLLLGPNLKWCPTLVSGAQLQRTFGFGGCPAPVHLLLCASHCYTGMLPHWHARWHGGREALGPSMSFGCPASKNFWVWWLPSTPSTFCSCASHCTLAQLAQLAGWHAGTMACWHIGILAGAGTWAISKQGAPYGTLAARAGTLARWNAGMLERWHGGVARWHRGTVVPWHLGTLAHFGNIGTLGHAGTLAHWHAGTLARCRPPPTLGPSWHMACWRHARARWHPGILAPCHSCTLTGAC